MTDKLELKSLLLRDLFARGYIYQGTNFASLDRILCLHDAESNSSNVDQSCAVISGYVGFDCTARSLHVGSLLQIMLMRRFQKYGYRPIILLGGATTKIGDPSDKNQLRKMLNDSDIDENRKGIQNVLEKFLSFADDADDADDAGCADRPDDADSADNADRLPKPKNTAIIVNNIDWWHDVKYLDFLRQYGRYFSVNRMMKFESVKRRLDDDQSLTFLEFNYMLLQAGDFLHLYDKYSCNIQFGGSEQWGNIVSGIDLIHRVRTQKSEHDKCQAAGGVGGEEDIAKGENRNDGVDTNAKDSDLSQDSAAFGITTPLITLSNGVKMGKTVNGAVWLSDDMLSPYEYWQFWRNTPDEDVRRFLMLYTDMELSEIEMHIANSSINDLKILLANAATAICHGDDAARNAENTARDVFAGDGISSSLPRIMIAANEIKCRKDTEKSSENDSLPLYKALSIANLCSSGSEARKAIAGGGVKVNDVQICSETARIFLEDFSLHGEEMICKISCGKKRHVILVIANIDIAPNEDGETTEGSEAKR